MCPATVRVAKMANNAAWTKKQSNATFHAREIMRTMPGWLCDVAPDAQVHRWPREALASLFNDQSGLRGGYTDASPQPPSHESSCECAEKAMHQHCDIDHWRATALIRTNAIGVVREQKPRGEEKRRRDCTQWILRQERHQRWGHGNGNEGQCVQVADEIVTITGKAVEFLEKGHPNNGGEAKGAGAPYRDDDHCNVGVRLIAPSGAGEWLRDCTIGPRRESRRCRRPFSRLGSCSGRTWLPRTSSFVSNACDRRSGSHWWRMEVSQLPLWFPQASRVQRWRGLCGASFPRR